MLMSKGGTILMVKMKLPYSVNEQGSGWIRVKLRHRGVGSVRYVEVQHL